MMYKESLEMVLDWISEHDSVFDDFLNHFGIKSVGNDLYAVDDGEPQSLCECVKATFIIDMCVNMLKDDPEVKRILQM